MQPDAIQPVLFISANLFSILKEVCLEGTGFILPVLSRKSHQRHSCQIRISAALHLSRISIPGDLGFEDPLTLPCIINEKYPANLMINSGTSSQFIDPDFARNLNLNLNLKPKPEDLMLADGSCSIIRQITHTCLVRLTIDQHMKDVIF